MKVGLEQASHMTGLHRTTIWRHIRAGRVSASREPGGAWAIDASELARAYDVRPPLPAAKADAKPSASQLVHPDAPLSEIAWLRERVEALVAEQAEERAERARLLGMLERQGEHLRALTDRRPWWRRLFNRA